MPVVLSAHIRNFLPFPRGCRLSCLVWAFPISQYCEKRKIMKKKIQRKISLMKTLALHQLHHCRVQMRSSRGRSRSLRAVPAAHELTFTREGSPGIVRNNHITEGRVAVKGTGTCSLENSLLGTWYWGGCSRFYKLLDGRCALVSCVDDIQVKYVGSKAIWSFLI